MQEKKAYLKSYRLQESTMRTLKRMIFEDPSKEERYGAKLNECDKWCTEIENKIAAVTDERFKMILYQKYVCGNTLEEISIILNYSKRHTERLHIAALKAFEM